MTMTPEEHLLAAADDMAEHGHCKESFFETLNGWETSPSCAYGSLARTAGMVDGNGLIDNVNDFSVAADRLSAHIQDKFPYLRGLDTYNVITTYNDANTTTAEDMILAMKEAAHHD